MTFAELKAQSDRRWTELYEDTRKYKLQDGSWYVISEPIALGFRSGGAHNVVDSDGNIHQLPAGAICVRKFVPNPDRKARDES